MKIQTSRDTHRPDKGYSGVYQQQARMLTDADWNELVDVVRQRLRDALRDVVNGGRPRARGLGITDDLRLRPGHVYADGVLAELPGDEPIDYDQQKDFPGAPDLPVEGVYILYADVWERPVISLEDSTFVDPAFHGADTCARSQTMVQIKWCRDGVEPERNDENPSRGNATLRLKVRERKFATDPPEQEAETAVFDENSSPNYLFRVEVHDVKWSDEGERSLEELTLKWSAENGAEQHAVGTEPGDFGQGAWTYEFYSDTTEKHLGVQLVSGEDFPVRGALRPELVSAPDGLNYVRRWDGYCVLSRGQHGWALKKLMDRSLKLSADEETERPGRVKLNASFEVDLETVTLELDLQGKSFVAGDYWLAAVREEVHARGERILDRALPVGIVHHYLKLARVEVNDGTPRVVTHENDAGLRRLSFPPLQDLKAGDIAYTAPDCPPAPDQPPTVQSLLQAAVGWWPERDDDRRLSGEQILDTLLCCLDAATTPYDPTNKKDRWIDINEVAEDDLGTPPTPNTVQGAIDDLVGNLESGDIGYVLPQCDPDPHDIPRLRDLLGVPTETNIKALWDEMLCGFGAATIPYDPTNASERWIDINELDPETDAGTPPRPHTVQAAIDDIVENLEASDIDFTDEEACVNTPYGVPTLKANIGIQGRIKLSELFHILLCATDAGRIPFKNECDALFSDANTIADALDNVCDLGAGDVKVDVSDCPGPAVRLGMAIPPGPASLQEVTEKLLCDLDATVLPIEMSDGLSPDFEGVVSVQDALNMLAERLRLLDAEKIPFDDACESLFSGAGTVQGALNALCDIDASNVKLNVSECPDIDGATVGSALGIAQERVPLDGVLNKLLCDLDAAKVPAEVSGGPLPALTIQESLGKLLAEIPERAAGASTVGFGGRYRTIDEAFEKLTKKADISLCLLPGTHEVSVALVSTDKRSIKITGAGARASVVRMREHMSLSADQISLRDLGVDAPNDSATLSLAGQTISAQDCVLQRTKGDPGSDWRPRASWARTTLSTSPAEATAIAADNKNNVVLSGQFYGPTLDLGGGVNALHTGESWDPFFAKFDPEGRPVWIRGFEGRTGNGFPTGIAVDSHGNVLLTGAFDGTLDFRGGTKPLKSVGWSLFVAKFDPQGQPVWSRSVGSEGNDIWATAITVDSGDNVLLAGTLTGTLELGDDHLESVGRDLLVVKIDEGGQPVWARNFGGTGDQLPNAVAVDSTDAVLVAGRFDGTLAIGGQPVLNAVGRDLYVAKFNSGGKPVWSLSSNGVAWPASIAVDHEDNVLLTGTFKGALDFGEGASLEPENFGLLVGKFDTEGQPLWVRGFGSERGMQAGSIAVDSVGNLFLTGIFSGQLEFAGRTVPLEGTYAPFLAIFDVAGMTVWSCSFGDNACERPPAVAVDREHNILLTGGFLDHIDFCGEESLEGAGSRFFLAKLKSVRPLVVVSPPDGSAAQLHWTANRMMGRGTLLALANSRVGGTIRDNTIDGVVSLMHELPDIYGPEHKFDALPQLKLGEMLHLHGNELLRLVTRIDRNAAAVDAYSAIIATDNVFELDKNSVVCGSLTMNGNLFSGAAASGDVAAVAMGQSAVFVGNEAGEPQAVIRWVLQNAPVEAANLLVVISDSAELSVDPLQVDFGVVMLPGTSVRKVSIANVGSASGHVVLSINNAQFRVDGPATFVLEPGADTEVTLVFEPTALVTYTGQLTVTMGRQEIAVSLAGLPSAWL